VTYWAALEGCKYACAQYAPELDRLCQPIAEKLEWYMGRHVAWHFSDAIFDNAHGLQTHALDNIPELQ